MYKFTSFLTQFAKQGVWNKTFGTTTTLPIEDKSWKTVSLIDIMFIGGILNFRPVDKFLLRENYVTKGPYGRCYVSWLKKFVEDVNLLNSWLHWMIVSHANQETV